MRSLIKKGLHLNHTYRNMDMSNIVERRNKMKKVLLGCGIALGVFVLVVVMLIAGLLLLLRGEEQCPVIPKQA